MQIFHCGGIDGVNTKGACAMYDIGQNKWTVGKSLKAAVNHAGYCTSGSDLVMVGGRGGKNTVGTAMNTCQKINMLNGKTSACTNLPYPVGGCGSCIKSAGGIWMFGGELNKSQFAMFGAKIGGNMGGAGGALSAVSFYDGVRWSLKKRMPKAKHGILPVVYGGFVYIVGGGTVAGSSASSSAYRANLNTLKGCSA
jgi:hypothetical protein